MFLFVTKERKKRGVSRNKNGRRSAWFLSAIRFARIEFENCYCSCFFLLSIAQKSIFGHFIRNFFSFMHSYECLAPYLCDSSHWCAGDGAYSSASFTAPAPSMSKKRPSRNEDRSARRKARLDQKPPALVLSCTPK